MQRLSPSPRTRGYQPAGSLWTFRTFSTDVASLVQPSHLGLGCLCRSTQGNEVQYSPLPPPLKNNLPPLLSVPAIVTVHEAASGVIIRNVWGTSCTGVGSCRKYVFGRWSQTGSAWRRAEAGACCVFLTDILERTTGPCFLCFPRVVDRYPLKHYQLECLQERRAFQGVSSLQMVPVALESSSSIAENKSFSHHYHRA